MTHSGRFSIAEVPLRILGLLGMSGCLFSQEDTAFDWEPRETGQPLTWETLLIGPLFGFACLGLWRVYVWFFKGAREFVNWERLRVWWPTGSVLLGLTMLGLKSWLPVIPDIVPGVVLLLIALLNFPVVLVVAMVISLLDETFHARPWVQLAAASLTMWIGGYLLVLMLESRTWPDVPVLLRLGELAPPRAKDLPS
jgi:hypothetical protein